MVHGDPLEGMRDHFPSVILSQLEKLIARLVREGRDHVAPKPNAQERSITFYHRLVDHTPIFHLTIQDGFFRIIFPPNLHFVVSRHFMMEKGDDNRCFVDLPLNAQIPTDEIQSWISQSLAYLL